MITIESLARELDVTEATITVLVDQIADDPDLWDAEAGLLTETGASIIRDEVASTSDPLMTEALADVMVARATLDLAREAKDAAKQGFYASIRAAVDKGHPRYRVATSARVSPQRVGQIYDEHR